jgi:aerobic-type carbon monoxide dehydrogenase small subunit (CoxS/CutS family)
MPRVTELRVNGACVAVDVDAEASLLATLREALGLTGAKIGCGEGECGACTVLAGGAAIRSCVTPVGEVADAPIVTIEGLEQDGHLHPLQQAFLDAGALQCGYCTPGMIMAGVALLERCPDPSAAEIVAGLQGNLCRCGAYRRIVRAVQMAARAQAQTRAAEAPR